MVGIIHLLLSQDFEWDQLQRLSIKEIGEANTAVMRQYASESFTRSMQAADSAPERPAKHGDKAP